MSAWTHVNASFRLDSMGKISDEEIIKIFGKTLDYDLEDYYDIFEFENKPDYKEYLPMGSEGTLQMNIWHNPDKSHIASTTVSIFGDLRDYDASFDGIEKWFNNCCKKCNIRQAFCQVNIREQVKIFQKNIND